MRHRGLSISTLPVRVVLRSVPVVSSERDVRSHSAETVREAVSVGRSCCAEWECVCVWAKFRKTGGETRGRGGIRNASGGSDVQACSHTGCIRHALVELVWPMRRGGTSLARSSARFLLRSSASLSSFRLTDAGGPSLFSQSTSVVCISRRAECGGCSRKASLPGRGRKRTFRGEQPPHIFLSEHFSFEGIVSCVRLPSLQFCRRGELLMLRAWLVCSVI